MPDDKTEDEHAEATAKRTYIREVSRRWPISAVARIYRPGCKADCALIEEGPQGAGKSSALAALVPNPDWFADEISDLGSKDSAQDLRGKWIIELAELSALKRGEIERTKAFMSRAVDHYRPSYGRRSQDFPRQCVFAGTTNAETYFGDETGNRRFWPVKVRRIDLAGLREIRDQLWAEAVAAFKAGEKWWLTSDVEKAAAEEQAERRIVDPWESYIAEWLDARGTEPATVAEAFSALGVEVERRDQANANRVARIFKVLGWERFQQRTGRARTWAYRLSPVEEAVSPVGHAASGDSQATAATQLSEPVTSVTTVTSSPHAHKADPTRRAFRDFGPEKGGGLAPRNSQKSLVTTGDTGDSPRQPPPPWHDDRAWIAEITRARGRDERVGKITAWGRAAGGEITTARGMLSIVLPPNLKKGMALNELHRFARELHIEVSMGGRA